MRAVIRINPNVSDEPTACVACGLDAFADDELEIVDADAEFGRLCRQCSPGVLTAVCEAYYSQSAMKELTDLSAQLNQKLKDMKNQEPKP